MEEKILKLEDMNENNWTDYLDFIFGGIGKKDNQQIILEAGFASGVYGYKELSDYLTAGKLPNYHTFATWKSNGYIVKKGQKAAFKADIWKYTEKHGKMSAEDAASLNKIMSGPNGETLYHEGDETTKSRFIKKVSFFFGPEQVEKIA